MSEKTYTATKSRNQGREAWSVIFRHPMLLDESAKTGRRVRRGLGSTDEADATRLVGELNELLRTPEMWEPANRGAATARYDVRVVDIFYDGLQATRTDFVEIREALIPLPAAADGYRKVLLLGTTGAGKTTVVRQILGTDPRTERFPSTSTAKTTVADSELITEDSDIYRAAITFTPRDEVVDYLSENVSEAARAVRRGRNDQQITHDLLDHKNQRFRFSYVLGRGSQAVLNEADDDLDDDTIENEDGTLDPDEYGQVDLAATQRVISESVAAVRRLTERYASQVATELGDVGEGDERVLDELIEDTLDTELRQDEQFHQIVDALVDEIEKRFATLDIGELRRNRQGWPISWSWESKDRTAFLKATTRFSANYAPLFGRLLTPLVNGIRVSGPFQPDWATEPIQLVLIDGEGLGHSAKSVSSLPTHVVEQIREADAVVLVDNAMQPMQAAPVAALKDVAMTGAASKLHVVFTHFDEVKGPNLPTFSLREEHVLGSLENVLKAIGEELGPPAERVLRRRTDRARFFVGAIHERLDTDTKAGARTIKQLNDLLAALANPATATSTGPSRPVFDRMNLSLAVSEATTAFHSRWGGLLGLQHTADAPKEHWTRIKALNRRFAEGWQGDGYDTLLPVADLYDRLQKQVYLMLQKPVRWTEGEPPAEEERDELLNTYANAVTGKLIELSRHQLKEEVRAAWQRAYVLRGSGSTFDRARVIASEVYGRAAPIPTAVASLDQNRFLKAVAQAVAEVADEFDVVLE